jgi:hypothetical protein
MRALLVERIPSSGLETEDIAEGFAVIYIDITPEKGLNSCDIGVLSQGASGGSPKSPSTGLHWFCRKGKLMKPFYSDPSL